LDRVTSRKSTSRGWPDEPVRASRRDPIHYLIREIRRVALFSKQYEGVRPGIFPDIGLRASVLAKLKRVDVVAGPTLKAHISSWREQP
jgi:hypothetical protein